MSTDIDLSKLMVNKDKPNGPGGSNAKWGKGKQLEALRYYLDPVKVKILAEHTDMRDGMVYAILGVQLEIDTNSYSSPSPSPIKVSKYVAWKGYLSYAGRRDKLTDANGYEYIKTSFVINPIYQFDTLADLKEGIYNPPSRIHFWDNFPHELVPDTSNLARRQAAFAIVGLPEPVLAKPSRFRTRFANIVLEEQTENMSGGD